MEIRTPHNNLPIEQSKVLETQQPTTPEVSSSSGLSISECKKHLGNTDMTDEEVAELRDTLFIVIDNIFDKYFDELNTYDPED